MSEPTNTHERAAKFNAWISIFAWLVGYKVVMHSEHPFSFVGEFLEHFDNPVVAINLLAVALLVILVARMVLQE